MTDKIDDGGPAFPVTSPLYVSDGTPGSEKMVRSELDGMSLRDWFAGMALSGLISTLEYPDADMALRCYALADAMIAARKPKSEPAP